MVMTNHNWLFISVSFLIILGGIGFPILVNFKDIVLYHLRHFWKFVRTRKLERHKVSHLYNLNTRIVLIMTFLLLVTGTLAIAAFEWNASFAGMPVADKWTQAFFNATCPRTAGFSSVDLASLSVQTLLVYLVLMWIGGGAGMAPLRAQIMHMTKTLKTTDRKMSYFYGARALNEVFYLEDFLEIEKEFPNFTFHLALDRPDPAADAAGVKYTAGFVHQVIYDTYLKDHEAPEDIEYYMCGPGPMSKAVENMLDNLGVPREMLHFDDFGA